MNEKSAVGGSRKAAIAVAILLGVTPAGVAPGVAVRGGPQLGARPGCPPNRPPDRLSHPSTLSLKKSVLTIRLEVIPPWECPTSQKALIFSLPICSTTEVTMFCRYSSSTLDQTLVGELGVAMTRRYLSL